MGGLGHTVSRFAKNLKIYLDKAIKYKSDGLRGSKSNKRSLPPSNPERKKINKSSCKCFLGKMRAVINKFRWAVCNDTTAYKLAYQVGIEGVGLYRVVVRLQF